LDQHIQKMNRDNVMIHYSDTYVTLVTDEKFHN